MKKRSRHRFSGNWGYCGIAPKTSLCIIKTSPEVNFGWHRGYLQKMLKTARRYVRKEKHLHQAQNKQKATRIRALSTYPSKNIP